MRARADFPRLDPALVLQIASASPAELADAMRAMTPRQRELIRAHLARSSYAEFVRQAWPLVEPANPLRWSFYVDAIADHLSAVYRREIRKLGINLPPRHGKSTLVTILWPAWVWTHSPQWRWLCGSYSATLSEEHSLKCRRLIQSAWYQENFARRWQLSEDQNTRDFYSNTASGHRIATGVGGAATGLGATGIILDDPLKAADAYSDAERARAKRWIDETMSTRYDDPATGVMVAIGQRLHEQDPFGWMKKSGDAEMLVLPAEFEEARRCVTYHVIDGERREFYRDPRQRDGELLSPERFTSKVLERIKREIGETGFSGQFQQSPAPAGGGMFKVNAWRFYRFAGDPELSGMRPTIDGAKCWDGEARIVDLEDLDEVVISVDATFKKTKSGSFVAIHVWGKYGSRRLLLDRVHARMDFTATVVALLGVIARWPQARRKLIEGKANGDAICDTLEHEHDITGIERVNPGDASKEQRAFAMQPYQSAGNVELYDGAPYLEEYILEHARFPAGATNDDVDAQSQALQGFEAPETAAQKYLRLDA